MNRSVVPVHGRFEAGMEGEATANPLDGGAVAVVKTPSGTRERVPLFWDGGRTWRLRYLPESAGVYGFHVESGDKKLSGLSAEFEAAGSSGTTLLDREGAPRVSASRRHFEHASGKPWFWLADTAWNGALLATEREWDEYLTVRAGQGFTAILVPDYGTGSGGSLSIIDCTLGGFLPGRQVKIHVDTKGSFRFEGNFVTSDGENDDVVFTGSTPDGASSEWGRKNRAYRGGGMSPLVP